MVRKKESKRARAILDARLSALGSADGFAVPKSGWVRAIRDALGMPSSELARRLGVTHGAVLALERSEMEGVVKLDSLRRAAEALDCTLIYAFIPRRGLEATVRERAEGLVDEDLTHVVHSMALEDQAAPVTPESREELVQEVLNSRGLWTRRQ